MQSSIIGYPRIGAQRELKFAVEKYFKGPADEAAKAQLLSRAKDLRARHWAEAGGLDFIPCNDFSLYDTVLDAAVLFGLVPARYRDLGLSPLDEYFAQARGYQGPRGDVLALAMKKWFNTNYHYLVPECDEAGLIGLVGDKIFDEFTEAKALLGPAAKPTITGIFTLFKLTAFKDEAVREEAAEKLAQAYCELLARLGEAGAAWVAFEEPALVLDLGKDELDLFEKFYARILQHKRGTRVLLQSYFGDIRDAYELVAGLDFDGLGLDFVEGRKSLDLVRGGFPAGKTLFAGVINGKNIYKNDYAKTLALIEELAPHAPSLVLGASCSLLHVPYSLEFESKLDPAHLALLSFAREKITELRELAQICQGDTSPLERNQKSLAQAPARTNPAVQERLKSIRPEDLTRSPGLAQRSDIQREALNLPELPTTTIGSFPQSADLRSTRLAFKKQGISQGEYVDFVRARIKECIKIQEEIGLDVLVHGEFERNDMVEYFGENLAGFLFTQNGWVQSYGTRCVKPPVIYADVSRERAITVEWAKFAQSQSKKLIKGMLTGPVTILNWSFPREDISLKESTQQIALAIRDEVLDLEAAGIKIIQIDEAALREKLPLRRSDWHSQYLSWAIPAFNLVHSGVGPATQIHTHMCYSEFGDILREIDAMDADVISFEASRSNLALLDELKKISFKTQVGPGVYDIHSPRVPSIEEIRATIARILEKLPRAQVWINPDCGLKTRAWPEVKAALEHMLAAARAARG